MDTVIQSGTNEGLPGKSEPRPELWLLLLSRYHYISSLEYRVASWPVLQLLDPVTNVHCFVVCSNCTYFLSLLSRPYRTTSFFCEDQGHFPDAVNVTA